MLTENILITLVGTSCGVLGAIGGVRALVAPDRPNAVNPNSLHQNYCDQLFHGSLEVEFLGQISHIPTAIRIPES
jgi:hypothetical protein